MSIASRTRYLVTACASAFLVACGGGGGHTTNASPPPPTGAATASLTVVNNSGFTISEVHIAPAGTTTWGPNQISSPIHAGGSTTIDSIAPGSYSLRAVASSGDTTETDAVALTGGKTYTWTLAQPAPATSASLIVVNGSGLTIEGVYIAPAGTTSWSANQISSVIPDGASTTIGSITPGTYDLKVVASTGDTAERYDVTLIGGSTYTWTLMPPSPPATASLTIVNNSGLTIAGAYIAPTGTTTWGPNQISSPIYDGGSTTVTSIPPGTYDLKVVASSGETAERYTVTLDGGATYTWTLTPPAPTTGNLQVTNSYSLSVTELYVTASSSSSWGPNQLTYAIASGSQFAVTSIPPGTYDVRAVASDGVYWEQYSVTVTAGATLTWTLLPPPGALKVVNSSSYTVAELHVVSYPNGYTYGAWGSNLLTTTIPPGFSYTVTNIPAGYWDVGAVSVGGAVVWTHYDTPIPAGGTYTVTLY